MLHPFPTPLPQKKRNKPTNPWTWNFDIDRHLNPIIPLSPLHRLPPYLSRWLGYRKQAPEDVGNVLAAVWAAVGAFCGLAVVAAVFGSVEGIRERFGDRGGVMIASFGASAILEYNTLTSPLGQPRNAILGHTFSAIVGVGISKLFTLNSAFQSHPLTTCTTLSSTIPHSSNEIGVAFIPPAVSCGIASAVMLLTGTVHPPGGASAVLAASDATIMAMGWWFVGLVALGSTLMVGVGLVVNNVMRRFPVYWWTGVDLSKERETQKQRRERKIVDEEKDPGLDLGLERKKSFIGGAGMTEDEDSDSRKTGDDRSEGDMAGLGKEMEKKSIAEFGITVLEGLELNYEERQFLEKMKWRLRETYDILEEEKEKTSASASTGSSKAESSKSVLRT